ncbi:hypothetical protein A0H76_1405 [Hepatospora eriocheir]|uniref:Uncharacterized protein n=1 Tax=Hepatospora eriocheir TaxID=1081669 RepID=A0A1X0QHE5_9MICR|nr:hypothetical protein A0H76_1405 [Hepatospora eriocheir]
MKSNFNTKYDKTPSLFDINLSIKPELKNNSLKLSKAKQNFHNKENRDVKIIKNRNLFGSSLENIQTDDYQVGKFN